MAVLISLESKAISSAKSTSVIFFDPTLLLFLCSRVNPSLYLSPLIAFLIQELITIAKRYGARVSPCSTPARISKRSDSPSGEMTFALVPSYIISLITDTIRFGMPYAARIFSILPRCTQSNAFLKSMNVRTAGSFGLSRPL